MLAESTGGFPFTVNQSFKGQELLWHWNLLIVASMEVIIMIH